MGYLFFSGFFSKEIILQRSSIVSNSSILFSVLFLLRIILTQVYSIRFITKVFLTSINFNSSKNFSEMDTQSFYAIIILFIPACLMGSFMGRIIKVNFDFFSDPSFLKVLVCLIFFVRIVFSVWVLKNKINITRKIFMFNLWLIPNFSGRYFSKVFFNRDINYKIFLNNLVETSLLYILKIFRLNIFKRIRFTKNKIMKLTIIVRSFVLIIYIYQLVYLNVKNISN